MFEVSKWVTQAHLNIYVPIFFQWYKKFLNPLSFDPCNHSLKIRESIKTLIPKVEVPLGVWGFIPSHFPTLPGACSVIPGFPSWPATLQALALVANLRLGLQQLWIPLWKFYSLLVSDPHKGESLGMCDEFPWGVVLT